MSLNTDIYIDKTGLIEITNSFINTRKRYMCISRPRRFGKSMALEMLIAYYSKGCNSYEQFKNLKIAKSPSFEKHLNKYNVLWLNMTKFKGLENRAEDILHNLNEWVINDLRTEFPNLIEKETHFLPKALEDIYNKTNEQFIILIDEWDMIFRDEKAEIHEDYVEFLRALFKDNEYVALAYLTGILPIKKQVTQSSLNNFTEYSIVNAELLAEYYGFTDEEVKYICETFNIDYEECKRWYDGYLLNGKTHIYNPNSLVEASWRKDFHSYWTNTASYEALKIHIVRNLKGLRKSIIELLGGSEIPVNIGLFTNDIHNPTSLDDVLTLLAHLGYLSYNSKTKSVFIPNKEIKEEFARTLTVSKWKEVERSLTNSAKLLADTISGKEKAVAKALDRVHADTASILKYNSEETLSCVITIAYYAALDEFLFIREMPTGKGYADLVLLPKHGSDKPALVIELKSRKTAKAAIDQIKKKNYIDAIKEYKGDILLVGINVDREKKHSCVIERVTKE